MEFPHFNLLKYALADDQPIKIDGFSWFIVRDLDLNFFGSVMERGSRLSGLAVPDSPELASMGV